MPVVCSWVTTIHWPRAGPCPGAIASTTPVFWTWSAASAAVALCEAAICSAVSLAGPDRERGELALDAGEAGRLPVGVEQRVAL